MNNKKELEKILKEEYEKCLEELKSIGFDINKIGNIELKISSKNCKRYGCCKQKNPDINTKYIEKIGKRKFIKFGVYNEHTIEISPWVFELKKDVIINTIMHEIIHCMPYCNNHGKEFKKYAAYINERLRYNITIKGNKEQDYLDSNLKLEVDLKYKYQIICAKCGYSFKRTRINVDYEKKYRCGKCGGRFKIVEIK